MTHPKMQYTYVGVDSHKDTHTAVLLDCFFEKLGEITFENLPSKFGEFLQEAEKLKTPETRLLLGLEDVSMYGRTLAVFLTDNGLKVKHVNALLVARERKNRNVVEKTDSLDAECAARVLLSKLDELPDASPQDKFWMLRTLVVRRDFIVKNNVAIKNHLHNLLTMHFPGYNKFFTEIDLPTSLAFFERFPSPSTLKGTTVNELADFLSVPSKGKTGVNKAKQILDTARESRFFAAEFQSLRDAAVQSAIRQIRFNLQELEHVKTLLAEVLALFDITLTSMTGIDVVTAAQILSCIGDVRRFFTPAKLAQYAGIAPVTYASGQKDKQFANRRGNRELNSLFFRLAARLCAVVGTQSKVINHFFYDYYHRKLSEGKTKKQALKCVQRRLVNIIWNMLTKGVDYLNPPMFSLPKDLPKEEENA